MKVKQFLQEGVNAKKLRVPAGETIIAQNEGSKEMYFIDTGKVSVLRRVPELGREIEIATLASGDFFGELAIMRGSPRMADVVAVTDCELWTLDKDSFKEAITK
ncbi:MAG: cyclic nucleotide-binding domain-containing protein, partial [Candidatus Brocadiales bacterium]